MNQHTRDYAFSHLGVWYKWGGNNRLEGMDCCLAQGTLVRTSQGWKEIERLAEGDLVASVAANAVVLRPVVARHDNGVKPVFEVRTSGAAILATANHRFLVVTVDESLPQGWARRKSLSFAWKTVEDLRPKDYIARWRPSAPESLARYTQDELYLLGLFLGDGHVHQDKNGFSICLVGERKATARTELRQILARHPLYGRTPGFNESSGINVACKALTDFILSSGLSGPSSERELPGWVSDLSHEDFLRFLAGYVDTDGYRFSCPRGKGVQFAAASERLMRQLQSELSVRGEAVTNITRQRRTKPIVIKGKEVKNAKDLFGFILYDSKRNRRTFEDRARAAGLPEGVVLSRVRNIISKGEVPTFDITVLETHNYITEGGVVVHNSGFVAEILRSSGLVKPHEDLNASMLFDRFAAKAENVPVQYGALLFFGDSPRQITHVAIALNETQMIEAGGGREGFDSLTKAAAGMGAMVRVRAVKDTSRPLVKAVMPPWPK